LCTRCFCTSPPPPTTSTPLPYTTLFRSWDLAAAEKAGYEDFFLKEMHEQPTAIRDTLRGRIGSGSRLALDDLRMPEEQIQDVDRSEEHTSELQSRVDLVCRLLLEKKKYN